jgi:signal transduction histidine kinase
MKQKLSRLSQGYVTALRKHLGRGARPDLRAALKVGHQAVALGLETLQLARIHEEAVASLKSGTPGNDMTRQANVFFSEALTPILETHPAARQSKMELSRLTETLNRRTLELSATHRQLQRGVVRRKGAEAALKKSVQHYTRLLRESLQIQKGLRQLTHKVLAAQEDERRKISHELQDEIGQTLLGINVRLLSLRQEARMNIKSLENEIASTQRLVIRSAKSVRRTALKFKKA